MRWIATTALVAMLGFSGIARADNVSLTNAQVMELLAALNVLDSGTEKVAQDNGKDRVVHEPFKLSGTVRLAAGLDRLQLQPAQQAYQDAVSKLRAQYMSDGGLKASADGKSLEGPKLEEYTAQVRQMLDSKQDFQLQKVAKSDLKLDDNQGITSGVIAALQPILEDK